MTTLAQVVAAQDEWRRCEAIEGQADMAGDIAPFVAVTVAWDAYRALLRAYMAEHDCGIREVRARIDRFGVAQLTA